MVPSQSKMTARIVILSRGDGEGSPVSQLEILRSAQDDAFYFFFALLTRTFFLRL